MQDRVERLVAALEAYERKSAEVIANLNASIERIEQRLSQWK